MTSFLSVISTLIHSIISSLIADYILRFIDKRQKKITAHLSK